MLAWSTPSSSALAELVFIDPPYEIIAELAPKIFARLTEWVDKTLDPLVFFETPGELVVSHEEWEPIKRIGGKNAHQPGISIFRRR